MTDNILLEEAAVLLRDGKIGIVPTDTLMGVVARADDNAAVARLYALKERHGKPGTIIAADVAQLVNLGLKRRFLTAVEQYWPGPISVVVPCANAELQYLHQGKQSLAVRIPKSTFIRDMLSRTGPLMSTSANKPGAPPATTADEARGYFGAEVDFYVSTHEDMLHAPSTLIQVIDDNVVVLRHGAATIDEETGAIT